ncbi:unnamed protein product, partial [Prorocentrum cordatum]
MPMQFFVSLCSRSRTSCGCAASGAARRTSRTRRMWPRTWRAAPRRCCPAATSARSRPPTRGSTSPTCGSTAAPTSSSSWACLSLPLLETVGSSPGAGSGKQAHHKRIYCFRDLGDALVSDWRFVAPIVPSDVPLESFAVLRIVPGGVDRALRNLCDWWEHRHDPGVCFFLFDDLRERRHECVVRVNRFLDVSASSEVIDRVVEQSSHEFMTQPSNWSKFDDHKIVAALDAARGHTRSVPLTGKARVGGGKSGSGGEELPAAVQQWLQWRWECVVLPRTGYRCLDELRAAWHKELDEAILGREPSTTEAPNADI